MKLVRCLALVASMCVNWGCVSPIAEIDRDTCYRLATTFFRKQPLQRELEFATYILPDKYATYICGMQYMHPPVMELAEKFAAEGAPAAIFLRERLASTTDDRTIRDIVLVYSDMQYLKSYDVAADRQLMALINEKVATITDGEWREYVARIVARITHQ